MVDFPSRPAHLIGPVGLLEKEKVAFVEHPDGVDRRFPDHQAGPDAGIDLQRFGMGVAFAGITHREEKFQQRGVRQQGEQAGKGGDGVLPAPVGVEELAARHGGLRMAFQKGEELRRGPFVQQRIGIEQQGIAARHDPEGLVVGGAEPTVFAIFDHPHLRETLPQHGHAAVRGGIVDDDHLQGKSANGLFNGLQTIRQEFPCVPVDNDDRDVHFSLPARRNAHPDRAPERDDGLSFPTAGRFRYSMPVCPRPPNRKLPTPPGRMPASSLHNR